MKRIIVSVVVLSMLMVFFCFPVSASEEFANDVWINIFDYAMPNGSDSLLQECGSYTFDLPFNSTFYYVEMVIRSQFADLEISIEQANGTGFALDRELISSDGWFVYRFFGNLNGWDLGTFKVHAYMESPGYLVFESFRASTLRFDRFDATCQVDIVTESEYIPDEVLNCTNGSDNSFAFGVPDGIDDSDLEFYVLVASEEWRKYDYMDYSLYVGCDEITSISVLFNDELVPHDIGYIGESMTYDNTYLVSLRLDLTGLNRTEEDLPIISLFGKLDSNVNIVSMMSCVGLVQVESLNPVTLWLRKIFDSVSSGFTSVTSSIVSMATSLYDSISYWGMNIYNNISTWGQNIVDGIASMATSLYDSISYWGQNIYNNISTWGQNIVNVLSPDTSASDEVVDDAVSKGDHLGGLNQQIGSIEKPDVSGSADISGIISPGDLSVSTTFLTTVVNAPYISQVVMLALILSLAAYVLFGKR